MHDVLCTRTFGELFRASLNGWSIRAPPISMVNASVRALPSFSASRAHPRHRRCLQHHRVFRGAPHERNWSMHGPRREPRNVVSMVVSRACWLRSSRGRVSRRRAWWAVHQEEARMSLTSGLSANRKLSRNGLLGDLPEADFWTAIASVVVVNRQVESLLRHKLYTWSRVRNSHGSSGCLRILQLCGCAVSGPSPH